MKYKAAIFDMDGVLVDSEYYWQKIELKIWQRLGVDANREFKDKIVGLGIDSIAKLLKEEQGIDIPADELATELNEDAKKIYLKHCDLIPGVMNTLDLLDGKSLQFALASASPQSWVNMVIDRFDLKKYFPLVLSTRTMKIPPKPDPAVFIRAMEAMEVSPDTTLIFEDSSHGVLAGSRSGATVVAVKDGRWPTGNIGSADLVIKSFEDKKLNKFLLE
ncbi:MAG: HAD family phosphatase [Parcubacteria group bacterium]|nr:HAD family phosphatase [Parcubacteria group bacterium]